MATAEVITRSEAPTAPISRAYPFSAEQYDRMGETGILKPDERVELLEGWVIRKVTQNPPHAGTIGLLNPFLVRLLPEEFRLRVQLPVALDRSRPEPDFAIVRGPAKQYLKRHPRPADIALVIEVADSSRLEDRHYKGLLYARAKLPEFWLINLVEGHVEVYSRPSKGRSPAYGQRRDYGKGEQVPLILDGQVLARLTVADLCPVTG